MKGINNYIQLIIIFLIIVFVNIIASYFHGYIDLTEEKRYTLSESTVDVTEKIDDVMLIRVLLDGNFPPGFERLKQSVKDLMVDLNGINPNIQYIFEDPSDGTEEEIIARRKQLAESGIVPTNLSFKEGEQIVQKGIYPYALISYKNRFSAVSLLQSQAAGQDENEVLNKSVELLEYKFVNIFNKLEKGVKQTIILAAGQGELPRERTISMQEELRQYYNVGRLGLDTIARIPSQVGLLMIAGPREKFSEKSKFKIDQYIMNGGRVMWMIDKMDASLDSINKYRFYVPNVYDLGIDDQLFKYGIRIEPNLVLDLESSSIPQIVGEQGGKPQTALFKWFYNILATPVSDSPIVKNIDRVHMQFPSTIDTVKTATDVKHTVLLSSSQYSRYQLTPMRLNFEILKTQPIPRNFDKGPQPVAILSEGKFPSLYKNRITPDFQAGLDQMEIEFKEESPETKQMFISDSDFMKNVLNFSTQRPEPVGYNTWDRKFYAGNNTFLMNAIEYMLDDSGILESRSKEIKLRMLDRVKAKEEESKWRFVNIGIPLLSLLLFGLIYNFTRKRRYAK